MSEQLEESKKQEQKPDVIIAIRPEDVGTKVGVSHFFPVFNPKRQMVETIELKTGKTYKDCHEVNRLPYDVYLLLAETDAWKNFVEETRSVGFLKPRTIAHNKVPVKQPKQQTQRVKKTNDNVNSADKTAEQLKQQTTQRTKKSTSSKRTAKNENNGAGAAPAIEGAIPE